VAFDFLLGRIHAIGGFEIMTARIAAGSAILSLMFCSGLAAARDPQPSIALPAGTSIPVTFPHTLDAAKLKAGDPIIAKTDQVVLGPGGERIKSGSQIVGTVVEIQSSGSPSAPSELAIRFDTLHVGDQTLPIRVSLRALASFLDYYSNRSPVVDNGYPQSSVYRQVGGDYFYQGDVVYSNDWEEVGKSTHDGVFVKLEHIEQSKSQNRMVCDSTDSVQSVGVFASSACGVYGFAGLTIGDAGASGSGVIRFRSTKTFVKIASGSTALLQVVAPSE
jgi:hypothetical protein